MTFLSVHLSLPIPDLDAFQLRLTRPRRRFFARTLDPPSGVAAEAKHSPGGGALACACLDGVVRVIDASSFDAIETWRVKGAMLTCDWAPFAHESAGGETREEDGEEEDDADAEEYPARNEDADADASARRRRRDATGDDDVPSRARDGRTVVVGIWETTTTREI